MTYKDQNVEIQKLLKRISTKSKNFTKQESNPNYGDLGHIIEELKEVDRFINDKYLN